jgi:hypothetical protein
MREHVATVSFDVPVKLQQIGELDTSHVVALYEVSLPDGMITPRIFAFVVRNMKLVVDDVAVEVKVNMVTMREVNARVSNHEGLDGPKKRMTRCTVASCVRWVLGR